MHADDTIIDAGPDARRVPAVHGWYWFRDGARLFMRNPLQWLALLAILFVLVLLLARIPALLAAVTPLFMALLFLAGRRVDRDGDMHMASLHTGLVICIRPLLTLGLISAIYQLLVDLVLAQMPAFASLQDLAPDTLPTAEQTLVLLNAMLMKMALMSPILAASYLAPALLLFHGCSLAEALKLSIIGMLRNWLPSLVMMLVATAFVFATFSFGILLLIPFSLLLQYVIYRDLFDAPPITQETP